MPVPDPGICTNGECVYPVADDCAALFCRTCCDAKCGLNCERQIAMIPEEDLPRF